MAVLCASNFSAVRVLSLGLLFITGWSCCVWMQHVSAEDRSFLPCWYTSSTFGIVRYDLQEHHVLRRVWCFRYLYNMYTSRSRVLLWWQVLRCCTACVFVNSSTEVKGAQHQFYTAVLLICGKRTDILHQRRCMNNQCNHGNPSVSTRSLKRCVVFLFTFFSLLVRQN